MTNDNDPSTKPSKGIGWLALVAALALGAYIVVRDDDARAWFSNLGKSQAEVQQQAAREAASAATAKAVLARYEARRRCGVEIAASKPVDQPFTLSTDETETLTPEQVACMHNQTAAGH